MQFLLRYLPPGRGPRLLFGFILLMAMAVLWLWKPKPRGPTPLAIFTNVPTRFSIQRETTLPPRPKPPVTEPPAPLAVVAPPVETPPVVAPPVVTQPPIVASPVTNPAPPTVPQFIPPPPIVSFTGVPTETSHPYAPSGRLLKCQLVLSVDSARIETPVIGLVTADLWHQGKLLIPIGTEVHGKAQLDRMRDRIVVGGAWKIVWQDGREMEVQGLALNHDPAAKGGSITDGSAGLKGEVIHSDSLPEIKLFLATALAATASGFQEHRSTVFGSELPSTFQNAGLAGGREVLNTYSQQVLESIKRDGTFVRVPGGSEFYLYLTEPVRMSLAKRAGELPKGVSGNASTLTNPPAQSVAHFQ